MSINDWTKAFDLRAMLDSLMAAARTMPAGYVGYKRGNHAKARQVPCSKGGRAEHVARVAEQSRDEFLASLGGRVSLRDWKRLGKRTAKGRQQREKMLVAAGVAWKDGGFGHAV